MSEGMRNYETMGRLEMQRDLDSLRAENARLKAAICDIWNGHGLCEDHGQLGYWKLGKYIDLAIALQPERGPVKSAPRHPAFDEYGEHRQPTWLGDV